MRDEENFIDIAVGNATARALTCNRDPRTPIYEKAWDLFVGDYQWLNARRGRNSMPAPALYAATEHTAMAAKTPGKGRSMPAPCRLIASPTVERTAGQISGRRPAKTGQEALDLQTRRVADLAAVSASTTRRQLPPTPMARRFYLVPRRRRYGNQWIEPFPAGLVHALPAYGPLEPWQDKTGTEIEPEMNKPVTQRKNIIMNRETLRNTNSLPQSPQPRAVCAVQQKKSGKSW